MSWLPYDIIFDIDDPDFLSSRLFSISQQVLYNLELAALLLLNTNIYLIMKCRHSDHNLLVAKIHTSLKKIIRFQKSRPRWNLEKLYDQRQRVQDTLEEKLGVIERESGNAEVQWNNIKECVLDTRGDLVGKVEKRARKPWITQEMIKKMDERRK